jgi:RNA polymerase sigma-70 factor (ECF subfamily)
MRLRTLPEPALPLFPRFGPGGFALLPEVLLSSGIPMQSLGEAPGTAPLERRPPAGKLAPHEKVAAVERAYRRHHPLVFRLALRYGRGSRAWAEDLVQEVFVDLLHAIEDLDELDALEGWLYRATSFRCLKQLRRERLMLSAPLRWLLGAGEPRPAQPDAITFANDELKRAFQALETLPPKERIAFSMYYLDGRPQHEIGEVMGHKKSYVCKLLHKAAEHLRAQGWEVPLHDV